MIVVVEADDPALQASAMLDAAALSVGSIGVPLMLNVLALCERAKVAQSSLETALHVAMKPIPFPEGPSVT